MSGSMRDKMPECAAFLDDLRRVFGKDEVDGWIRVGIKHGTFFASENGHVVGVEQDHSGYREATYIPEPRKRGA